MAQSHGPRGVNLLQTLYVGMFAAGAIAPLVAALLRTRKVAWPVILVGGLAVVLRILWLCMFGPLRPTSQRVFAERVRGIGGGLFLICAGGPLTLIAILGAHEIAYRSTLETPCLCARVPGLLSIPVFGAGVAAGVMVLSTCLLVMAAGVAQLVYSLRHR